jgi:hypothetical protein
LIEPAISNVSPVAPGGAICDSIPSPDAFP